MQPQKPNWARVPKSLRQNWHIYLQTTGHFQNLYAIAAANAAASDTSEGEWTQAYDIATKEWLKLGATHPMWSGRNWQKKSREKSRVPPCKV